MSLVPVVERELRAASRRSSTFRIRWWTTLLALAISFIGMAIMYLAPVGRRPGSPLFTVLTGYAFLLCLITGVLLTSDALAQEKREGTLGLLLLTDLKGYDIVLGKLFAHSLTGFYALLALLPATALPVLTGGVGGAEFFRMSLSLANALFLSLTIGIFVSAFSRESQNALGNSLGLVIILTAVCPALAAGFGWIGAGQQWKTVGWFSPLFSYGHAPARAYMGNEAVFWASLGLTNVLGWLFLAVASFALPRAFQDQPVRAPFQPQISKRRELPRRSSMNRELLTKTPIVWLRSSELGIPWAAWMVVLAWAGTSVCMPLLLGQSRASMLLVQSALVFGFCVKLLFAGQACRFFVDARRNGTLELLLCTPVSSQEIIQGQMKAVLRNYAGPLIALGCVLFLPILIRIANSFIHPGGEAIHTKLGIGLLAAVFVVRMTADVFAILWLGTALALTSRRPGLAPLWTILLVLILPSPLSFCWVDILVDLVFISWATNRCRLDLRRMVAEQYQETPQSASLSLLPRIEL